MSLQQWTQAELAELLPLEDDELEQISSHVCTLSDTEATKTLNDLLDESPRSLEFIREFIHRRARPDSKVPNTHTNGKQHDLSAGDVKGQHHDLSAGDVKHQPPAYAPPPGSPPRTTSSTSRPAASSSRAIAHPHHTNAVIEAGHVRAKDEQDMQQALQSLQFQYRIYNSDIEPEHESEYPCSCPIHRYQARKWARYGVQDMWSKAVIYPGEKSYNDDVYGRQLFNTNPYKFRVTSPYGSRYGVRQTWGPQRPIPQYHARSIHDTIDLNNQLNHEAQMNIDNREPKHSIWEEDALAAALAKTNLGDKKVGNEKAPVEKAPPEKGANGKRQSVASLSAAEKPKPGRFSSFRQSIGIKSSEERQVSKASKAADGGKALRDSIIAEENGRWPDEDWRQLVAVYQAKVGMSKKIADLRAHSPIQYLHLLRAGFFEPIPVAWASQASNPLKFSVESAAGWRGITPAWRGYEDLAEERLYWVLNHREGSVGMRMKPDFISEMNMARDRAAKAVPPPPAYYSANDTCHLQHTTDGYSNQVMPPPFHAYDRPESPTDDTMILLDVSGSMDFDPVRPVYQEYLITRYDRSTQPKNKDVAKAIIRRFTDAMANHDHQFRGYDLTTFSDRAKYIGTINHQNLDHMWRNVKLGGGTRVMTGWQQVKELHFQKHSNSAIHHPVYGWQAGPDTPMLRLLLLLDGEATDMDEFELDLLGLSWAHVTIFLIGVDGCPHHHRHANELQRISDVNHHVSFVDAQGNTPERYVTHELLKRHLGYDISMQEFTQMEELPAYQE